MLTTSIHKDFIGMMADALTGKMNGTNTSNFLAIDVTASFTCCPILFNQLEFCFKTTLPCSVSLSVSHDPVVLNNFLKRRLVRSSSSDVTRMMA